MSRRRNKIREKDAEGFVLRDMVDSIRSIKALRSRLTSQTKQRDKQWAQMQHSIEDSGSMIGGADVD